MPTKEPRFHGEVTEKSHKNMSKIRGKDTNIEVVLRKALWHRGFRYRKNYKGLPGRPDIVLAYPSSIGPVVILELKVAKNYIYEKLMLKKKH